MNNRVASSYLSVDGDEHRRWIQAEGEDGQRRWDRLNRAKENIAAAMREEERAIRQRNLVVWFFILWLIAAALSLKSDASLDPHITVTRAIFRIAEESRWCLCGALIGYLALFLGESAGTAIRQEFKPSSVKFTAIICICCAILSGFTAAICFILDLSFNTRLVICTMINSVIFWCLFTFSAYGS
jgi:hypothetical protein